MLAKVSPGIIVSLTRSLRLDVSYLEDDPGHLSRSMVKGRKVAITNVPDVVRTI